MIRFPAVLAAATSCALLAAQQATNPQERLDALLLDEVAAKLGSDVPMDVAWGGHLAQRYRLKQATKHLCTALDRWQGKEGLTARIVRLHLIDGLLGCGGKVPASQVAPALEDPLTRDAAFAIIAEDPMANREAILQLALAPAEYNDLARTAAARLLISRRIATPELGDYVLQNFRCKYNITVRDPDSIREQWESAVGLGGGATNKRIRRQDGFPPLPRIQLSRAYSRTRSGKIVVSNQFKDAPIVLGRTDNASYRPSELEAKKKAEHVGPHELTRWIYGMSNISDVRHRHGATVDWKDEKSFLAEVVKLRDEVVARNDRAVNGMRAKGWLSSETPDDFRIPLEVELHDERGKANDALPDLPPLPPRVLPKPKRGR